MHKQEFLMNKYPIEIISKNSVFIIVKKKHSKFQYLGLSLLDKLKCIDDDNHDPLYQDNNINISYHHIFCKFLPLTVYAFVRITFPPFLTILKKCSALNHISNKNLLFFLKLKLYFTMFFFVFSM